MILVYIYFYSNKLVYRSLMKKLSFGQLDGSGLKIGIVVARWNSEFTYALRDSCKSTLLEAGVLLDHIPIQEVPGSFEVVYGARQLIAKKDLDAVIAIGCLIKGQTMHFEYIAEAVSQGIMNLNIQSKVPIIFGVLTCLSEEQARERAIGVRSHANSWSYSAIEMALLKKGIL